MPGAANALFDIRYWGIQLVFPSPRCQVRHPSREFSYRSRKCRIPVRVSWLCSGTLPEHHQYLASWSRKKKILQLLLRYFKTGSPDTPTPLCCCYISGVLLLFHLIQHGQHGYERVVNCVRQAVHPSETEQMSSDLPQPERNIVHGIRTGTMF